MSNIRTGTISGINGTDPVTLTKQSAAKMVLKVTGNSADTISSSLNVASITDNGTGDYTLNMTSAFNQAQVVLLGSGQHGTSDNDDQRTITHQNRSNTTSAQRIRRTYANGNSSLNDGGYSVIIMGDLA